MSTVGSYDGTADFSGNYPSSLIEIGTFSFDIPAGEVVTGATISGTFGNDDVPGQTEITADADLYVDGSVIDVASCESPNVAGNGTSLACDGGNNPNDTPTAWSYTFSASDLTTLATAFAGAAST